MRARGLILVFACSICAFTQEQLQEFGLPVASAKQKRPIEVQIVRGIVVDEYGAVIPKAEIVLRKKEREHSVEITQADTDFAGRFRLNVPVGKYEVMVHRAGFKDEVVAVWGFAQRWPRFQGRDEGSGNGELYSNAGGGLATIESYSRSSFERPRL